MLIHPSVNWPLGHTMVTDWSAVEWPMTLDNDLGSVIRHHRPIYKRRNKTSWPIWRTLRSICLFYTMTGSDVCFLYTMTGSDVCFLYTMTGIALCRRGFATGVDFRLTRTAERTENISPVFNQSANWTWAILFWPPDRTGWPFAENMCFILYLLRWKITDEEGKQSVGRTVGRSVERQTRRPAGATSVEASGLSPRRSYSRAGYQLSDDRKSHDQRRLSFLPVDVHRLAAFKTTWDMSSVAASPRQSPHPSPTPHPASPTDTASRHTRHQYGRMADSGARLTDVPETDPARIATVQRSYPGRWTNRANRSSIPPSCIF